MDIDKVYGTDKEKEDEGVWCELADGGRIKVGRHRNSKHRRRLEQLIRPKRGLVRSNNIRPEELRDITIRATAECLLLDWEGFTKDGEPFPYSVDNAIMLLTAYPDFFETVAELSQNMDLFRKEVDEESLGNLQST